MVNLSACTKPGQLFTYGDEIVGLQYILCAIWEDKELPEIQLVKNDENFNKAVSDILHQMYVDSKHGVENEEYEMHGLHTVPVIIDITKEDIQPTNEHKFEIIKEK